MPVLTSPLLHLPGAVSSAVSESAAQPSPEVEGAGETVFRIGRLEAGSGEAQVRIDNLPASWPR